MAFRTQTKFYIYHISKSRYRMLKVKRLHHHDEEEYTHELLLKDYFVILGKGQTKIFILL